MDSSPPGSSVHGILQARILEWVAISFSSEEAPTIHFLLDYLGCFRICATMDSSDKHDFISLTMYLMISLDKF